MFNKTGKYTSGNRKKTQVFFWSKIIEHSNDVDQAYVCFEHFLPILNGNFNPIPVSMSTVTF